ncbi:MAG TPA: glycosyltransferase, partial [Myxococcota bacterium]|nr:glycosyltransferase [Myxococcota bacterium]
EGLRRNRALAVAMGERGRARVLAEHTWDAILERVLAAALRAGPARFVPPRTAGLPSGGA